MLQGNVVDQFHDNNRLANTRSSKETNFSTLCIRRQQVHNLDTSEQLLGASAHFCESWRWPMNWVEFLRINRSQLIDGFSNDVNDSAKCAFTNRHADRCTSVNDFLAA